MTSKGKIVIDGKNAILGRLASYVAKQALLGKNIEVVNCDEVVVSGKPMSVIMEYKESRQRGGSSLKGPFFPRSPQKIFKRTVRGMLSYKQGRGRDALKRVRCYDNVPVEYEEVKKIIVGKEKKVKTINLKELGGKI